MKLTFAAFLVLIGLTLVVAKPLEVWEDYANSISHARIRRQNGESRDCTAVPPTHTDSTVFTAARVASLRAQMAAVNLDAYIIPSEDAHGSEYIAERDRRRTFISGFSGSAGLAVVTTDQAAVWVDGRYFLQVDMELECIWQSMKQGEAGVPTTRDWLACDGDSNCANLPDNARVGVDPKLISVSNYQSYEKTFAAASKNITMISHPENLIDAVWSQVAVQPGYPGEELMVLGTGFTGRTWKSKIYESDPMQSIREALTEQGADALVVNQLDEVAWIFNLRGADIPYNPMFISYALITSDEIRLYMYDDTNRLDASKYQAVRDHLELDTCEGIANCIKLYPYDNFVTDLATVGETKKVWFSQFASYAIFDAVKEENRIIEASPILLMKAVKNEVERAGMRSATWKDSISICEHAAWLQEKMDTLPDKVNGDIDHLSELSAEEQAVTFREVWPEYTGLSFGTISAFGDHAAIIHYSSSEATDVPITNQGTYMLDSGGQYKDGTTDITRTFHFGEPTDFMKEAYTRVLMGHIDLSLTVFRTGVYGRELDSIARAPLWEAGLDYRHGTGHGIGHFLNVHEGPARITLGYRSYEEPFQIGMFSSDEPGYYHDGEFGIRLENDFECVEATTPNSFSTYTYMTFNMISLVPYEPNLIKFELLSKKQIDFYNNYNQRIRDEVYSELSDRAKAWVTSKTQEINYEYSLGSASSFSSSVVFVTAIVGMALYLQD